MAQLRDSKIDGNLEVIGSIVLQAKYDINREITTTDLGSLAPDGIEENWISYYTEYKVANDRYFVLSNLQTTSDASPTYSYINGQTENATSIYMRTIDVVDDNMNVNYYLLTINNDLILNDSTFNNSIQGFHPETGEASKMLHMSQYGNTIVGYDGYENENGNTHLYGNDIVHYVSSAGKVNFRPYYRAGDVIDFTGNKAIRTAGYVTSANKNVVFTICLPKPVIGSPTITVASGQGFVLRQDGNYTHGSAASTFVKPTSYSAVLNPSGIVVTAVFDVTTSSVNNDSTGIYWDGTITLS